MAWMCRLIWIYTVCPRNKGVYMKERVKLVHSAELCFILIQIWLYWTSCFESESQMAFRVACLCLHSSSNVWCWHDLIIFIHKDSNSVSSVVHSYHGVFWKNLHLLNSKMYLIIFVLKSLLNFYAPIPFEERVTMLCLYAWSVCQSNRWPLFTLRSKVNYL
jgi:hypothetical protein